MNQVANIEIFGKTYPVKDQLKKAGLKWTGKTWAGQFPLTKIEKLKAFCRHHDLQYTIEGENIKESRLPRGQRTISTYDTGMVMGEGRLEWWIQETVDIETQRRRRPPKKS